MDTNKRKKRGRDKTINEGVEGIEIESVYHADLRKMKRKKEHDRPHRKNIEN